MEELSNLPRIKAGREVYKKLGKAPSKYHLSLIHLYHTLFKYLIYKINNIVDINNLISLNSSFLSFHHNICKI